MRLKFFRVSLIIFLAMLFVPALPTPVSAVNGMFSCWCQDEATRVCNHHRIDSGVAVTTDFSVWPIRYTPRGSDGAISNSASVSTVAASMDITPARRTEILGLCAARCAADGGKRSIHYETTYREEICSECNADPDSSCTEERGARLAFGDAQEDQLTAKCEDRRSESLLPVKLAVPIGGVSQVSGIPDYINVAYRYLVTVVLVVAIVMVVYGGFRYLVGSSIGDVQAGKKIIVDAIVGMLIVLGAYMILSTVNPNTTLLSFTAPEPIECVDLDIPEAIKNARCTNDSACPSGQRCVEGQNYVFKLENVAESEIGGRSRGRELGNFVGQDTGSVIGDIATHGFIFALIPEETRQAAYGAFGESVGGDLGRALGIGAEVVRDTRNIRVCSTGEQGSPCLEDQSCRAGLSCIESWSLCWTSAGNAPGQPCDTDAQCSNGSCVDVSGTDYKVCELEVRDGTPCFRPDNGASASTFPIGCNGPPLDTEFVCVWCPNGEGGVERNWTYLSPGLGFPAQCKPRSVLTSPTPCAR